MPDRLTEKKVLELAKQLKSPFEEDSQNGQGGGMLNKVTDALRAMVGKRKETGEEPR